MNGMTEPSGYTETNVEDSNVWASLPVPLFDLFVQDIVPVYLTVEDLIHLSRVSRRYLELFSPRTAFGRKILTRQLLRDSQWGNDPTAVGSPYYSVVPQLPSFGSLSPEESIREDPLLVAQLKKAASRRRGLIHIRRHDNVAARTDNNNNTSNDNNNNNLEPLELQLQRIVVQFKAKRDTDIMRIARMYHVPPRANTEFLCINKCGVDVYCHWIDHTGNILVRDGDRIPSHPDPYTTHNPSSSFVVPPDGRLPHNGRRSDMLLWMVVSQDARQL
jgi:hypothetical protein